jgi:hypothetical protein
MATLTNAGLSAQIANGGDVLVKVRNDWPLVKDLIGNDYTGTKYTTIDCSLVMRSKTQLAMTSRIWRAAARLWTVAVFAAARCMPAARLFASTRLKTYRPSKVSSVTSMQ